MKLISTLTFFFILFFSKAQRDTLRINYNIVLLKDSGESNLLTKSLNEFLDLANKPNEENRLIFENEKIETFIQLDELKGIEKSARYKDDDFFKPYLTNVVPLKDRNYFIQISYLGSKDDTTFLAASFNFIAHKINNLFFFSSPLLKNTTNWKLKKVGKNTFHFKDTINNSKTIEYNKLTTLFDAKLNSKNQIGDYYCCENIIEMEKLIGIEYKADYNGQTEGILSSSFANKSIVILGDNNANFDHFDPHDLWHDRLSQIISRDKINRSVDEGCAYLYGGSWGLTWKEIFKAFKEQVASDKNTNWAQLKEAPIYFKTKQFRNSADYIVNALLVQKIEREKGFAGVWELLNVGPYQEGNEKYYETLEKLTGITKENYNTKVWDLINKEL